MIVEPASKGVAQIAVPRVQSRESAASREVGVTVARRGCGAAKL
jgi:hypothetical protein